MGVARDGEPTVRPDGTTSAHQARRAGRLGFSLAQRPLDGEDGDVYLTIDAGHRHEGENAGLTAQRPTSWSSLRHKTRPAST